MCWYHLESFFLVSSDLESCNWVGPLAEEGPDLCICASNGRVVCACGPGAGPNRTRCNAVQEGLDTWLAKDRCGALGRTTPHQLNWHFSEQFSSHELNGYFNGHNSTESTSQQYVGRLMQMNSSLYHCKNFYRSLVCEISARCTRLSDTTEVVIQDIGRIIVLKLTNTPSSVIAVLYHNIRTLRLERTSKAPTYFHWSNVSSIRNNLL